MQRNGHPENIYWQLLHHRPTRQALNTEPAKYPETERPSDITFLLTAPTGTADFNSRGFTLHSALKLPRKLYKCYDGQYILCTTLGNLTLLIIGKISMVD